MRLFYLRGAPKPAIATEPAHLVEMKNCFVAAERLELVERTDSFILTSTATGLRYDVLVLRRARGVIRAGIKVMGDSLEPTPDDRYPVSLHRAANGTVVVIAVDD